MARLKLGVIGAGKIARKHLEVIASLPDVEIFHAGTKLANNDVLTSGGRVLAVTALGPTITEARTRAYDAVALIHFEGAHFRRDIALSAASS